MFQPVLEEADDVLVVERVEDHASGAPRAHETHAAKQTQLVRDGGLAQPEEPRDVAHAQLRPRQRVEDPHARRIAQNLECFRQRGHRAVSHQPPLERGDLTRMQMEDVARFVFHGHT